MRFYYLFFILHFLEVEKKVVFIYKIRHHRCVLVVCYFKDFDDVAA